VIKSDKWIRRMAAGHRMIEPFEPGQVREAAGHRIVSYGTSSYGYDIRCSREFKIFTNINSTIVDPKAFDAGSFVDFTGDVCIIPPNSFALARTVEFFRIPRNVLVVVDEAYSEYIDAIGLTSALRLTDRYPNLIVTRTFSKAYGLAGLRVGYFIAHPSVVEVVERLRESFNVNNVALVAAEAALGDAEHVAKVRVFNKAERAWLVDALKTRGYAPLPSQTNFVLVDVGGDAAPFEKHLFERGVIVRPMQGYGFRDTVRISIGSRPENQRLVDALP